MSKDKDEIKLAIEGKDRDYFLSKGIPFPNTGMVTQTSKIKKEK